MKLAEMKALRKSYLEELKKKKLSAKQLLNEAVEAYRKHIEATEKEVFLKIEKEMSYTLTVMIDELEWKVGIDLRFDTRQGKPCVYAIFDHITEYLLSDSHFRDFGKAVNDRIMHTLEREASRYEKKLKTFR